MILKIPIYLESDLKLSPERVNEIQKIVQSKLTEDIKSASWGDLSWKFPDEGKIKFKLLSFEEVVSRVTKG